MVKSCTQIGVNESLPNGRFINNCNGGRLSGGRVRGLLSKYSNGNSNSGYPSATLTNTQKQLALSSSQFEPCSSRALINWSTVNATTSSQPEQSTPVFVPVMSSYWQADFQSRNKYQCDSSFMNLETILSQRIRIPDLRSNLSSRYLQQIRLTTSEETPLIWEMLQGYRKFLCFRKTGELIEDSWSQVATMRTTDSYPNISTSKKARPIPVEWQTVDDLSDREDLILQETKMALHNELYLVCQRAVGGDTTHGVIRFATLCNMVTFAHRFFREVSACISLVNASNLAFETDTLHNPHAF
ncbi:hypothetical protein DdX_17625 [Ditylenchus destructor]|uniref:Uncharacterized protein n=1 Tax=Ditylenchus destructor TaxID=166010 RepID=A0AAD4MR13_9BILA|nr:hypothetical protein DdX_17625 [Ditylenchus destructor]